MSAIYPHERRIRSWGYVALAIAVALAFLVILRGDARFLRIDVPKLAQYALLLVAVGLQVAALTRRQGAFAVAAGGVFVLAVAPAATDAGWIDLLLAVGLGGAVLASGELVHMMERYERAHRAVDDDNVPEDHINRVTDESMRTLLTRLALALGAVLGVAGLAWTLRAVGPAQWRFAAETTAPLGIALIALVAALVVTLIVLARGAALPRLRRTSSSKEISDVPE